MSLDRNITSWIFGVPRQTVETKQKILHDEALVVDGGQDAWRSIAALYVLCVVRGAKKMGDDLLKSFLDACPSKPAAIGAEFEEIRLIWHYSEPCPGVDWPEVSNSTQDAIDARTKPEHSPTNPAFFQLKSWTQTDWIESTDYPKRPGYKKIDDTYDPHCWRDSDDPWTHAICARLLCQVPAGEVADRAALEEAFEAVDKLFTKLPLRKTLDERNPGTWPHTHIFPLEIYLLLAEYLGKRASAMNAIAIGLSKNGGWGTFGSLLGLPQVYKVLFDESLDLTNDPRPTDLSEIEAAIGTLKDALETRKRRGGRDEFVDMSWPDLLRRFSEAVYESENKDSDDENEDDAGEDAEERFESAADVLLPPLTPEEIASVEEKLGPLPEDLKEMSLVARGFKGTWHFAGGGFPGIQELWEEETDDHAIFLGIMPEPKVVSRTTTMPDGSTETVTQNVYEIGLTTAPENQLNAGMTWVACGTVENDGFLHLICPPKTWSNLMKGNVQPGEYRVINYAHWTAGPSDGEHHSMRDWIVSLTKSLEKDMEMARWN